jgi:(R,R)-butanediol dehydrogenase/meso-butanediol dehydrogenase/diacetyl reductase
VLTSAGDVVSDTVPVQLGPGLCLVEVAACGVCGTDLQHYLRRRAAPRTLPDLPIGHEIAGTVVAAWPGDGSSPWRPGTRAVIDPCLHCGSCPQCRAGQPVLCTKVAVIGTDTGTGGIADRIVVPAAALVPLGSPLPPAAAALAEPLACAHHALGRAADGLHHGRVVVVGGGSLGVLVGVLARARGADVLVVDPAPARRDLAASIGLTAVDDVGCGSVGIAVVATSDDRALGCALDAVARGGEIVVAGTLRRVELDAGTAFAKQVRLSWSLGADRRDFAAALQVLAAAPVEWSRLVEPVPREAVDGALFEAMAAGRIAKPVVTGRGWTEP